MLLFLEFLFVAVVVFGEGVEGEDKQFLSEGGWRFKPLREGSRDAVKIGASRAGFRRCS